jgi:hypothetical protein
VADDPTGNAPTGVNVHRKGSSVDPYVVFDKIGSSI